MLSIIIYKGVLDQVLELQTDTYLNVHGIIANNFLIQQHTILFVKNAHY